MTTIEPSAVPSLAAGCRLSPNAGEDAMLLIPEGALRLVGPALEIVLLCDGVRSLAQIVADLQAKYATADPARIEAEVRTFLGRLYGKRALDLL